MNKRKMLISGLFFMFAAMTYAQWHDALDDASGTYTYSRTPSWNDAQTVIFNTTGENMEVARLLDGAGLFSKNNIAGKRVTTSPDVSHVVKIPWSSSTTETIITFALNKPAEIKQFYVQVPFNVSSYSLPPYMVKFQYSDDNRTTWQDFGQTSVWTICNDNVNSKYCTFDLPLPVKKSDVRLILYSACGYDTFIDEVEFRYIKWKDSLDDASGTYTYSRTPSWNDAQTVIFNTCGNAISTANLLDGSGLYSQSNLAGWSAAPAVYHTVKIPWSFSDNVTITFSLDNPIGIRQFYLQTTIGDARYDAFVSRVKFQYSDDGYTWQDFGETSSWAPCYDNPNSRYFTFDLAQLVKKKNIRVIAYSQAGYNTFIDEIEFRAPRWPLIFEWLMGPDHYYNGCTSLGPLGITLKMPDVTPVPTPGSYLPAGSYVYSDFYNDMAPQDRLIGVYLNEDYQTGPIHGREYPPPFSKNTLNITMGLIARLDFVFADFESVGVRYDDIKEMVRLVRTNSNPEINQAWLGNFDDYPGPTADAALPHHVDYRVGNRQVDHDFYMTNCKVEGVSLGLNIAQPHLYQLSEYGHHANVYEYDQWPADMVAPNVRSALFWAPLEKYSGAKRHLPAGHLLIPWVSAYCNNTPIYEQNPCPTPLPHDDVVKLLLHVRLRGSDGYYGYRANGPGGDLTWDNDDFRLTMYKAWKSLDWLLDTDGPRQILNMNTSKTTGLQWSCTITDKGYAILISNLNTVSQNFTYPSQLTPYGKSGTISVPANTHILQSTLNPL